jgi:signal recognition particle subunit SRP68
MLLTAERAWAHAMHMKSTQAEDSASQKFPGATRSHIVSRLVKASKQANALALILRQTKATPVDVLEAQAYASYLGGSAEFEKLSASPKLADTVKQREKWRDCLEAFSVARVSYAVLAKKTKADCFKDMLTNEVDPGIRVAAYQSQIPRTVAIAEVARRCFSQDKDLVATLHAVDDSALKEEDVAGDEKLPKTLQWRSRTAKIVDASIGQALLAEAEAEATLSKFLTSDASSKQKAAAYDELLIECQDTVDTTRHIIEELERERIPESDARMQDLRVTNLKVNYDSIGWRVGRNRVLIGFDDGLSFDLGKVTKGQQLAKLRERVVLYDQILQSIDSVKDVRGAVRDVDFVAELDGQRAYFQALRYVARF